MESNLTVSVVIPAYNEEDNIVRLLNALSHRQGYRAIVKNEYFHPYIIYKNIDYFAISMI
jgi:hypothetical protein